VSVTDPGTQPSGLDPDEPTPDEHDPSEDNDESGMVVPPDKLTNDDEDDGA
jgi:hypothetical protein